MDSATIINDNNNESNESNHHRHTDDKNIIDKILGEMKSQFNKTERKSTMINGDDDNHSRVDDDDDDEDEEDDDVDDNNDNDDNKSSLNEIDEDHQANKTEDSTNGDNLNNGTKEENHELEDQEEKPRIVLLFKKPNTEMAPIKSKQNENNNNNRRSLRNQKNSINQEKCDETVLKRSTRRRSKDCTESILQSAIARKEKSYNESNKPQRLTRQLKPTQKILENLELAKQEKTKLRNNKILDKNRLNNDNFDNNDDLLHKKKHKHIKKSTSKTKRLKIEQSNNKESDSDHSTELENRGNIAGFRRSRRISSRFLESHHFNCFNSCNFRYKDETSVDTDDQTNPNPTTTVDNTTNCLNDNNNNEEDINAVELVSKLCLCTQKTQYYIAPKHGETIYCSAIDSVGDKTLGCSRVIETKEIMMLRPSTRIPYSIYCESHKNRLLRHNCCPSCGIFCTQGHFVECKSKHQYHKDCKLIIGNLEGCPHCGVTTQQTYDINITMHTIKKPIFLPMQKAQ